MDLSLTDDQELLRETTRRFLETESPIAEVRRLESEPSGFDGDVWRRGADLGWTSMLVTEADGGGTVSGAGLLDLVVMAEEMGRLVAPGPLLPTNVVAGAVSAAGDPDQKAEVLPGLLSGAQVGAWCHASAGHGWLDSPNLTAVEDGDGFTLTGVASPVEAGGQADWLLVGARTDAGPTLFVVPADAPGVVRTPLAGIDLVKRFASIRFDDVRLAGADVLGDVGEAEAAIERQLQIAVAIQTAETVGAAQRVFEFSLDYVDDRMSFGRPLSSYQALKHRFADMKMWLEASVATATGVARAVQSEDAIAVETVSAAKSYVGPRMTDLVQDCVQMHGGIGVTWEHDLHLYLRRVTLNREMYGTPAEHRERIATLMGARA